MLAAVNPAAVAVIVVDPTALPVTCGCVWGDVALAAIKTLFGAAATEALLLVNETVTPPDGAGVDKVTGSVADWFSPTVAVAGSVMAEGVDCVTVTPALAPVILAALA